MGFRVAAKRAGYRLIVIFMDMVLRARVPTVLFPAAIEEGNQVFTAILFCVRKSAAA